MKKALYFLAIGTGVTLLSLPASAMNIEISGEPCLLTVYETPEIPNQGENVSPDGAQQNPETTQNSDSQKPDEQNPDAAEPETKEPDSTAQEVPLTIFELYGIRNDMVSISFEERTGFVPLDEFAEKFPEIPVSDLPDGTEWTDIGNGASGENVKELQQALIDLGYMEGTADGNFGSVSAAAISKFQEEHRIKPTGIADINTQMALVLTKNHMPDSLDVNYPANLTADIKFAKIWSQSDADLDSYLSPTWRFNFDEFEHFGTIDSDVPVGSLAIEGADIDRITMNASLKVVIDVNEEDNWLDVLPSFVIESSGSYRPYLQSVILSDGIKTVQIDGGKSRGSVNGSEQEEFGYIPLTEEALAMLMNGSVTSMRIKGLNQVYDMSFEGDLNKVIAYAGTVRIQSVN